MNILVFAQIKLGSPTGYGQAIWNLVRGLAEQGLNVHVICGFVHPRVLRHPLYREKIHVYTIPFVRIKPIPEVWHPIAVGFLLKVLKKEKIDLIHGHIPHSWFLSLVRGKIEGLRDIPFVVTSHWGS